MNSPKSYNNDRGADPALPPLRFLSPMHKASRQLAVFMMLQNTELRISTTEAHLLTYLLSYGSITVGGLLRIFGIKNSTLTSILDRLEDRGLVARQVNQRDRRSFLISLTRQGKQTATRVRRTIEVLEDKISSNITQQDMTGFRRVMEAIATVTSIDLHSPHKGLTRDDESTGRRSRRPGGKSTPSSTQTGKDRT